MSNIVYLNGKFLPKDQATVNVEDRGFLYADGVYEVVRYYGGKPLAMGAHVDRLRHSLGAVRIALPADFEKLPAISEELIRRNSAPEASMYWQVTRGVAPRKHAFPPASTPPTVLAMHYADKPLVRSGPPVSLKAIVRPDHRWWHCEIKAISLLANVLDAQAAVDAGCQEAILERDGVITEGTHRTVMIARQGKALTYPLDGRILDSITRRIAIDLARTVGLTIDEVRYNRAELDAADEVIALGSTTEVASIVEVDGKPVGNGKPGPIATRLLDLYRKHVIAECGL
jgi:D-alanine transaminase